MFRRVMVLLACALVLASCRLDVDVDLTISDDGTGTVQVVAVADAALVDAVPTIADELVLDDVVAAGWLVDGPTATADGGLTLSISHSFTSPEEATNLLNSIGPPFNQMSVTRSTVNNETTTRVTGLLGLSDGFESFADADLITAVGSLPFADEIEASGETPATSMSARFGAVLPGEIDSNETNGSESADGGLEWIAPLDGEIVDVRAQSVQAPGNNDWWARPLSIAALIALIVWVTFMTLFIGYVVWARSRRARRYRRRRRPAV